MNEEAQDNFDWERGMPCIADTDRTDHDYLLDLIKALKPYPAGLRRWSVMRTIRKNRETAHLPIPQKIEVAVERTFRKYCADAERFKKGDNAPERMLFYWPQGKLGGLWAVYPDLAEAWLKAEGTVFSL